MQNADLLRYAMAVEKCRIGNENQKGKKIVDTAFGIVGFPFELAKTCNLQLATNPSRVFL